MATRQGPTKGGRILVELPFGKDVKPTKGKAGKNKLVLIKEGVAAFLGSNFKPVDKLKLRQVSFKTAAGTRNVRRITKMGSYRGESVTLLLKTPQTIKGSRGRYKTLSLPLGSGCNITDAAEYFQKNNPQVIGIRTSNGHRIQWGISGR